MAAPKVIGIARLQERPADGGGFAGLMLIIGAIAMFLQMYAETSAVRLAAWGSIWTGWNVLWGFVMLMNRRSHYTVVRDARDGEAE